MFSNTTNVYFATGNNSQKEFTFPFQFQTDSDVIVKILDEDGLAIETLGSLDYTITNSGLSGGKILLTFNSQVWMDVVTENLKSGYQIMIKREPFINQTTDFRNAGRFLAEQHEDRFDKQTYFDQDLQEQLDRTPKFDEFAKYDIPNFAPSLPRPVDGKFLRWNGVEGEVVNSDFGLDDLLIALQDLMETYADDGDAATLASANIYADAQDILVLDDANAYTDSELAGKANAIHTHDLSDLNESGAIPGQVVTWSGTEWAAVSPVSGVTDHSLLTGLAGDDHTQYHNDARGDARYYTETELDAGQLDNRYYTETETDALLVPKLEAADIANFETTTQLNIRDTNNRARANHTGTQTLSTLAQSGATTNQVAQWNGTNWVPATASGGVSDGDKGDVTVSGTGATWTIDNDVVTNAKAANMAANTLKGNNTGSAADPIDLTVAQTKTLLAVEPTDLVNTQTNPYNRPHESRTIAYDDTGTGGIQIKAVQPMMARTAHVAWYIPNVIATTVTSAGMTTLATQGTATGKAINNQVFEVAKAIPRIGYRVTTAATTAVAAWRASVNSYYMTGQGSAMLTAFTSSFIFGPDTGAAASAAGTLRCFAGFTNATGVATDVNPNAIGAQVVGVGARNTDTNYHIFIRAGAVDKQIIDTGIGKTLSAEDTDMFQLIIESAGGRLGDGLRITFRQLGINFSPEFTTFISGPDLPTSAQQLCPRVQYSVGGTSSVIGVSIAKFYSEQYYGAYGYL